MAYDHNPTPSHPPPLAPLTRSPPTPLSLRTPQPPFPSSPLPVPTQPPVTSNTLPVYSTATQDCQDIKYKLSHPPSTSIRRTVDGEGGRQRKGT
ncbi:hypothetical protein Pcinc_037678 [Petrolisthes cinctipes]|uniref:Uncharacterized protein n=1 Tax=Petrolisthes cinctipes TaxID=88211 RepID=A0AAE1BRX4_PETCI|nr:hypothetical protein Pcinc_037678 [Petrolisthes cinctipes]